MADADGRLIPLVEDDQGEGIKDFYEDMNPTIQLEILRKKFERHNKMKESKPEWKRTLNNTLNLWKSTDTALIESLIEMVFNLNAKIDFIFDGHVLINGKFTKPKI